MAERQEELRQLANGGGNDTWQSQLEALQTRQAQLAVEQAELGRHAPSTARSSLPRYERYYRLFLYYCSVFS